MILRVAGALTVLAMVAACGADDGGEPAAGVSTDVLNQEAATPASEMTGAVALACEPSQMPLADRPSPYDSTMVNVGGAQAKICYGRPSARDREIVGGLLPYDTIWRTGANEPTIIHLPVAAEIAGLAVEPGSYAIYTVPRANEWTVIVNRSTSQWGIETAYTPEVRAQEVGRASVPVETIPTHEETFVITTEPGDANATNIVLTWERTRVRIPIRRV